jgi:hypothetical protein
MLGTSLVIETSMTSTRTLHSNRTDINENISIRDRAHRLLGILWIK